MGDRRFGFECELAAGALDALGILVDRGLASPNNRRLHAYHCGCSSVCDYESQWTFRGQNDCTADGELITKILTYGSDEADTTISGLADALLRSRARTSTNVGFHVHVGREDLDTAARLRLARMFLRYQDDLAELASTSFSAVREYNSPMRQSRNPYSDDPFWTDDTVEWTRYVTGSWLTQKPNTFEFRLWNSTRAEWRMHLAVGVSVAMVNAAADGVNVSRENPHPLEFVLGDYLDDRTWAGIIRQRYSKGGIAA